MASSIALLAAVLVGAALVAGIGLVAVMASGVWWLRRRVRRRLGVLGLVLASRPRGANPSAGGAGSRLPWSLAARWPLVERCQGSAGVVACGRRGRTCGGGGSP
jgi:hypothetical protein